MYCRLREVCCFINSIHENYALYKHKRKFEVILQWNPSKADTIGTKKFVRCSEVSFAQGLVVDHAPPTIAASYDKGTVDNKKGHINERSVN